MWLPPVVGYTGGHKKDPTYEEVSSGTTGHAESIEIVFDPAQVTYSELLDLFWRNVDPTTRDRQFVDVGDQYRTAIFFHSEEQRKQAVASKEKMERSGKFGNKPIVTEIVPASTFYPAEEYHQKYYQKNSVRYKFYRFNSGQGPVPGKDLGQAREGVANARRQILKTGSCKPARKSGHCRFITTTHLNLFWKGPTCVQGPA